MFSNPAALLRHRLALGGTIVLSFVVQFFSILTFWLLARALGEAPDAVAIWVVWPVISLFLALPISFAGWGLREGLMVFYLSYLHMGHEQALALSLLLGCTVVLTSLPGALLWIGLHRHRGHRPRIHGRHPFRPLSHSQHRRHDPGGQKED